MAPRITDRQAAVIALRDDYKLIPGSVVYTTVLHVSRSGMTRAIKAIIVRDGVAEDVSWLVAKAIGGRLHNDYGGVKMSGCGMDMTFALVYALSRSLFPDGHDCTGDRDCPSNDHANDWGVAQRKADAEMADEGHETYGLDRDARTDWLTERNAKMDRIRTELGLDYRKGRHHSDGGYALKRSHL